MSVNLDPKYPTPPVVLGVTVLDPLQTPFTDLDLAVAYTGAFNYIFPDQTLERRGLCALMSQVILETGRVHCWRNNLGNVKGSSSYRGYVQYFRCGEIINGGQVFFDPYNPAACFRAFMKLSDGAEQQLRFLGTSTNPAGHPNRYQAAFDAALAGDVTGMVEELHRAGYMTADMSLYLSGCQRIFTSLLTTLPGTLPMVEHEATPLMRQPTNGRAMFTDDDLTRIAALQLQLSGIDWAEWQKDVQDQLLMEDLP